MAFRDDNEALRARIELLEDRNAALEEELEQHNAQPEAPTRQETPKATGETSELARLVAKRDAEKSAEGRRRADALIALSRRPRRVTVERNGTTTIVRVAREQWPEALRKLAFPFAMAVFMFGPAMSPFINGGFPFSFVTAFFVWVAIVTLATVAWARVMGASWVLEMSDEHFALRLRRSKKPKALGKIEHLKVSVADSGRFGVPDVRIQEKSAGHFDPIEGLDAGDVRTLLNAIATSASGSLVRLDDMRSDEEIHQAGAVLPEGHLEA